MFVDVFTRRSLAEEVSGWQARTPFPDVRALLLGFLGKKRTNQALRAFSDRFPDAMPEPAVGTAPADIHSFTHSPIHPSPPADPRLLNYAEKLLAGSLGPASARMLVASVAGAEEISYASVVGILKESQQLLEANRQLQKQSRQLQRLTDELRADRKSVV